MSPVEDKKMIQEQIAIRYPVVLVGPFVQQDIAASQTDVDLTIAADHIGQLMPHGGKIIGATAQLSVVATTGTLTWKATVDGVEIPVTARVITTETEDIVKFSTNLDAPGFAEGLQIGAQITTDGAWDGLASDIAVWLWVVMDNWEF